MPKTGSVDTRLRLNADTIISASISEFSRISGISRSKTYELLDAGELESIRVGSRRLILLDSFWCLIERARVRK